MNKNSNYVWKLGMFVLIGIVSLIVAIYFIGQNQNMFGSTFRLRTHFNNVGGLQVGNNVRFSGIDVGTVKEISFISDSVVIVRMVIKDEVQKYIKTDALASIGSDGLMGDKILSISPGTSSNKVVKDNAIIASSKAIELEDLMTGLKSSIDNAEIITTELAIFSNKLNNDNSVLSRLVSDERLGRSLGNSLTNVEHATKELTELEAAAKENFLLKGYFKKKKKAAEKKKKEAEKAAEEKKEAALKAAEKKK
jgi:phospholipid/cholesterol/gamma-HCH transport system substrate-binding protein